MNKTGGSQDWYRRLALKAVTTLTVLEIPVPLQFGGICYLTLVQ